MFEFTVPGVGNREVGKFRIGTFLFKLENPIAVGKFLQNLENFLDLESFAEIWKFSLEFESREIGMGISNLIENFSWTVLTSVLILKLHSFRTVQLKAFQPKLSNFSIFSTALSNFMSAGSLVFVLSVTKTSSSWNILQVTTTYFIALLSNECFDYKQLENSVAFGTRTSIQFQIIYPTIRWDWV